MGELVDRDQEHLRLLRWSFYLLAGVSGLFALFSLIYIGIGAMVVFGAIPASQGSANDMRVMGFMFLFMGLGFLLGGLTGTFLTYFAGRSLGQLRRRVFCMVMGGFWCMSIPFGTAIGVATILVLNRPSVRALFEGTESPQLQPPSLPA